MQRKFHRCFYGNGGETLVPAVFYYWVELWRRWILRVFNRTHKPLIPGNRWNLHNPVLCA